MVNWAVEIAKLAIAESEIQKALAEYRQTVSKVKAAEKYTNADNAVKSLIGNH